MKKQKMNKLISNLQRNKVALNSPIRINLMTYKRLRQLKMDYDFKNFDNAITFLYSFWRNNK